MKLRALTPAYALIAALFISYSGQSGAEEDSFQIDQSVSKLEGSEKPQIIRDTISLGKKGKLIKGLSLKAKQVDSVLLVVPVITDEEAVKSEDKAGSKSALAAEPENLSIEKPDEQIAENLVPKDQSVKHEFKAEDDRSDVAVHKEGSVYEPQKELQAISSESAATTETAAAKDKFDGQMSIIFSRNSHEIEEKYESPIADHVMFMLENPLKKVVIKGYSNKNKEVSPSVLNKLRVQSLAYILIGAGIEPARLIVDSGEMATDLSDEKSRSVQISYK